MGKLDLLKELLKDDVYSFNYKYILNYLEDYLMKLESGLIFNKKRIRYFLLLLILYAFHNFNYFV
jgi:hypothetical protein